MKKIHKLALNIVYTLGILVIFFCLSLCIDKVAKTNALIPAIFALAVFLVSLVTDGYFFGILSSIISVFALNFAFTFPYFKFNFSIPENLASAIIMLVLTVITSTLTTKIKQTEKMRAESEMEKMRANLLRAVSHDLRTPLTTIYGSSATIVEGFDYLSKEQVCQLADGIQEDAQWLIGMVENLLSVTKIGDEKVVVKKTETVLEELIDAVLIRFKKRYPNQEIELDIPDEFICIPMDVVLIEQVIVNILENAVKHAYGMDKLKLKVYVMEKKAIFEISDNGCGIAKEKIDTIFQGYFEKKQDVPVDNHKSSMGIGLSVCASIIKAHEGEISVKNLEGGGCCFMFSLNLDEFALNMEKEES